MKISHPPFILLVPALLHPVFPIFANEPSPILPVAAQASEDPSSSASADPLAGAKSQSTIEDSSNPSASSPNSASADRSTETNTAPAEKVNLPPLTPDLANLNLGVDLELETLDTKEKVFLPAGTYRQILRIPLDSPAMQTANQMRQERRPKVKIPDPLPPATGPEKKPLWIRYESLEKIKIGGEERRGGLDIPINGPAELKLRLWYAKSETADTASSVFYFLFGGLGYSAANLAGWSAGNTREIPANFEYRLIRR